MLSQDCQVMDMTVVSCDGRIALVDFDVIDSTVGVKTVRAEYIHHASSPAFRIQESDSAEASKFVAQCPRCLADVREIVLVQRETNTGKN